MCGRVYYNEKSRLPVNGNYFMKKKAGDSVGYFFDCGLLVFYGFLSLFFMPPDTGFLIAFLCCVCLICLGYVLKRKGLRMMTGILFGLFGSVVPEIFLFYPCLFYLFFHEKMPGLAMTGIALFLCQMPVTWENRGFFAAAGVFGFLLAFLMERNTRRTQILEKELRRTQDDSKERNLLLSQKNKALQEKQDYQIYNATLKERNRIAREIHDNVGHVLSRSILMVGAARTINKEPGMSAMLENLEDSLNHAMNSIRSSVHDLHDEAVNLEEVEKGLVKEFTFCPVEMTFDMTHEVPRDVKYCFISITKEAFANIMKHSNATKVQLILREHPALYQLCVEDNGTGAFYDPGNSGMGIGNMKERVKALGGTMQIFVDKGFRIFITIPK